MARRTGACFRGAAWAVTADARTRLASIRPLRRLAILALVAATSVLAPAAASAASSYLVYYDSQQSPAGLWAMNTDGSNKHSVAPGYYGSTWSNNLQVGAFQNNPETFCSVSSSGGEVYASDPSFNLTALTGTCGDNYISPDGSQVMYAPGPAVIAFASVANPGQTTEPTWTACYNSSNCGGVGPGGEAAPFSFAWVNSHEIAFADGDSGVPYRLLTAPATGGTATFITPSASGSVSWGFGTAVNPGGTEIVGGADSPSDAPGAVSLYEVPVGGGPGSVLVTAPANHEYQNPEFSPDGKYIVFEDINENNGGTTSVDIVPAGGGTPTVISGTDTTAANPSFGPGPPPPKVSISDPSVIEPDKGQSGEADFTVSLSAASSSPVSVTASTLDGSATAPNYYTKTSQTITFPANSTKSQTFKVPVVGGAFTAGQKDFFAKLSNPQNAQIGTGTATATLTAVSVADIQQPCNSGPCPSLGDGAARGGTAILIRGRGFTNAESVEFVPQDGAPTVSVPANVLSDAAIAVTTPDMSSAVASAASGHPDDSNLPVDVVVEVPDGHGGLVESAKTSDDVFSFDIPVVSSVSPSRGIAGGGNTLTITGKYFTGADNISLITADNSAVANIPLPAGSVQSDTTISLKMPDLTQTSLAGALGQTEPSAANPSPIPLPLDVAVLVPATDKPSYLELTSLPDLNAYSIEPFAITGVSPGDVPVGRTTTVTIKGVGFVQATDAALGGSGNQQVVFQPQPAGLGSFCFATSSSGPCTIAPQVVSDSTMTVQVPSYLLSSWFAQPTNVPLPFDLRISASIGGVTELTPTSAADVLNVHPPQVTAVSTPPGCHPGSIVTLAGNYLDGVGNVVLTATGNTSDAIHADGTTTSVFPIIASPSGLAASFTMPSIADEAATNGGFLSVYVIPLIAAGPRYVYPPANPSDKLTWDNNTGKPCGPPAATASTPSAMTANAAGRVTAATVSCPAGSGGCTVTASITQEGAAGRAHDASSRRGRLLGKVTIHIPAGHNAKVKLKLKSAAFALLRQRRRIPVILKLTLTPKFGEVVTVKRHRVLRLNR